MKKPAIYDPAKIEKKWQKKWTTSKIYQSKEDSKKQKYYVLDMFPYPSGEGLHVGHPKGYIATDVISRMKRMQGHSVLHPMGFDAFGLPAENYALKTKTNPADAVKKNVAHFKKQLELIGLDYDWSREINTTDPKYYKWTQWIFLQLFKKGLAYESYEPINWCPSCKTGLANEDVENGHCERCGTLVEKKPMRQWVLKITDYAERLLKDLDVVGSNGKPMLDWPNSIKELQKNWIGKSEGALLRFKIQAGTVLKDVDVFTTRPDTLFGVTYIVLAPEHKFVQELIGNVKNGEEVEKYIEQAKKETEIERTDAKKQKTGVELKGILATNPANNEKVPVWISDYVLADYGTGAVMAVPAHDERDWVFAKKFGLPVKTVIEPLIIRSDGTDSIKNGLPMVERRAIVCIIKHWEKDEFLLSLYKKNGWKGFVVGGIEGNESIAEAGIREIREETGYQNISYVREVGRIHSQFFHEIKNVNRYAHFEVAYFELQNGEQEEMNVEEGALHDIAWYKRNEVADTINREDIHQAWKFFMDGNCYTGSGLVVNSSQFDQKNSVEIRKVITEFAGGQMKTTYKLRDWVFSRQRYWGEPIPVVHCSLCAAESYQGEVENSLNFYYADIWNGLKNGTKTIETRALNPEEKDRYFGDIKVGDVIRGTFKDAKTKKIKEELMFKIKSAKIYRSLKELYEDTVTRNGLLYGDKFKSLKEFEESYAFTPDYRAKIAKNGLIAWHIEPLSTAVLVPEKDLPVILPKVKSYEPTGTGESPLAAIEKWVNTKCPVCKGPAKRETNTMPQWAGSSWYYFRYEDPKNAKQFVAPKNEKYWSPVDLYVGGAEHATRHLIYSRFWHKFLFDLGVVSTVEPFTKLQHVGLIMGEDGRKMSKRFGNVVNPDDVIKTYGADTLRVYTMFMGPFDQQISWSTSSMVGARRFVEKIWRLSQKVQNKGKVSTKVATEKGAEQLVEATLNRVIHKAIKKVSADIESLRFNTAISTLMIMVNEFEGAPSITREQFEIILKLVAPFAPHVAEELWTGLGNKKSIHIASWPKFDPKLAEETEITIMVQVNGKVRASFASEAGAGEDDLKNRALGLVEIQKWIKDQTIKKVIVIKGRIVSIVV